MARRATRYLARMLVWLASYPRSGNTLTRAILNRVFEVPVPSVYPEGLDGSGEHDWGDFVPLFKHPQGLLGAELADWARSRPEIYVLKTHEFPDGLDDPAIILVRDGRAAMASYERYIRTWWNQPTGLEQIVIGAAPLSNWSDWLHAWHVRAAPRLTMHYEDVATNPAVAVGKMAEFLDLAPRRDFDISFEEMQATNPRFFRVGANDAGIAEVERRCPNLFWALHGAHMRCFGYDEARLPWNGDYTPILRELSETIDRLTISSPRRGSLVEASRERTVP